MRGSNQRPLGLRHCSEESEEKQKRDQTKGTKGWQ